MKDWPAIRDRYLQDPLPVRLGGLAANLRRIKSFAHHDNNKKATENLVDESKFFIEWTALDAGIDTAAELVEIQIQLAHWKRGWDKIWADPVQRARMTERSLEYSERILEMSGLLKT
jgi:hypothetical protein